MLWVWIDEISFLVDKRMSEIIVNAFESVSLFLNPFEDIDISI